MRVLLSILLLTALAAPPAPANGPDSTSFRITLPAIHVELHKDLTTAELEQRFYPLELILRSDTAGAQVWNITVPLNENQDYELYLETTGGVLSKFWIEAVFDQEIQPWFDGVIAALPADKIPRAENWEETGYTRSWETPQVKIYLGYIDQLLGLPLNEIITTYTVDFK